MIRIVSTALLLGFCCCVPARAATPFEQDVIRTNAGDLEITFIGHGSLMMRQGGKVIHIDPYGKLADYATLPKADVIFITHEHQDHLDTETVNRISGADTVVVLSSKAAEKVGGGVVMNNGDTRLVAGIGVEAVPAYNLVHKRDNGQPFHPRGAGNGYLLTIGDRRIYIAGDTENTPEMKSLKSIDYAFLPMNLPYTMTPEMVADAVLAFKPTVLYPYHYGDTDTARIVTLLKGNPEIEVRIRRMK
jgi:L-ascorbate metabolism protein UlaG (beta-lactamase superfamily)